jgi:hypothetical protein
LTTEAVQILQPLRHCVRRLSVENWNATVPRPEHDLPPLGVFRGLKELTLYRVSFAQLAELRDYLSGVAAPLDSFQLTECVAMDQDDMFAIIYPFRSVGHGQAFELYPLAVRKLELVSLTDDTFDAVLLRWLALSPHSQHIAHICGIGDVSIKRYNGLAGESGLGVGSIREAEKRCSACSATSPLTTSM